MQSFTLASLLQIPSFELRAKILAEGLLTGSQRAKRHGSGAEFVEHRLYTPGDSLRDIDWKVLGRFDRYYIRKREEEKTLVVWLVIDASHSMDFGERETHKLSFAVHLAAALAYFFTQGHHEVGLMLLQGKAPETFIPPRSGQSHLARIFASLQGTEAKDIIDFTAALQRIAEQKRRSLVFVFSDLLSFDPETQTPLALMPLRLLGARGHDVTLFQTLAPQEISFPYQDLCEFEDLEDHQKILLDAGGLREAYQEEMQNFLREVKNNCEDANIEYQTAKSDESLNKTLVDFFQARLQR
jgi:uncharacterized protein (DUF58 family)